ncbi:MAG: orotidine-5'-phosphate decarboxylase [Methylocystaceae bacterium]
MQGKDRITVALDVDSRDRALDLARQLKDEVGVFKIGMQLFNSEGPSLIQEIAALGRPVFVDLKFHDIPNTVAAAGRVMTRLGASIFNVHAAGGREMMSQVRKAVDEEAARLGRQRPLILAVTVLTSIDQQAVNNDLQVNLPVADLVVKWAIMAKEAGMDGVVASPQEITAIRTACGPEFIIITPGVRPVWAETNDQKRIMTPREAYQAGADYLVIGRPITSAADPAAAARRIADELEG